jgi:molybdopterin synthase catalytic subunit
MSVHVGPGPIDLAVEAARLALGRSDVGAVVTFTGLVRGETGGKPLVAMTLEHYPGMTEAELTRIGAEAAARWRLIGWRIVHRVGRLEPGETIVLVATASAHRRDAFAAAEFLMDYLKTRAPFWKKEETADGAARWVEARDSDDAAAARWTDPLSPAPARGGGEG